MASVVDTARPTRPPLVLPTTTTFSMTATAAAGATATGDPIVGHQAVAMARTAGAMPVIIARRHIVARVVTIQAAGGDPGRCHSSKPVQCGETSATDDKQCRGRTFRPVAAGITERILTVAPAAAILGPP
jgi:hypothetical protein